MASDRPHRFQIGEDGRPASFTGKIVRTLSALEGQFADAEAYAAMRLAGDPVLYEVYDFDRPHKAGELLHGVSIVHPGKVGREYFMTKGHFHAVLETGEIYYCLHGRGLMLMETPEGEWAVEQMEPGTAVYVAPRWAHRSVNTGEQDLVMLWAFPGNAGHDYGTIEQQGFARLVVERDGQPAVVENPRWLSPARRHTAPLSSSANAGADSTKQES